MPPSRECLRVRPRTVAKLIRSRCRPPAGTRSSSRLRPTSRESFSPGPSAAAPCRRLARSCCCSRSSCSHPVWARCATSSRAADPGWLVLATLFEGLSFGSYIVMFGPIFCTGLGWRRSWQIGGSELAMGSLVPASGAGGSGARGVGASPRRDGRHSHRPPIGCLLPDQERRQLRGGRDARDRDGARARPAPLALADRPAGGAGRPGYRRRASRSRGSAPGATRARTHRARGAGRMQAAVR